MLLPAATLILNASAREAARNRPFGATAKHSCQVRSYVVRSSTLPSVNQAQAEVGWRYTSSRDQHAAIPLKHLPEQSCAFGALMNNRLSGGLHLFTSGSPGMKRLRKL
jgi:hypothetical protein